MYKTHITRKIIPFLTGLAFLSFCLISCGKGKEAEQTSNAQEQNKDVLVARVNGNPLYLSAMNESLLPFKFQYKQGLPPQVEGQLPGIEREFLDKLIDQELMLQEAKRLGLQVSEGEIKEHLEKLTDTGEAEKSGASPLLKNKRWMEGLKRELLVRKFIQEEVTENIFIPEAEIKGYYESHLADFYQPLQVRIQQITLETERDAEEILKDLHRGEDFAQTAQSRSLSPDGERGGDMGYFSRGQMPEEFDAVAFGLKKGEISRVFKSPYGYHIFKLLDKRDERQLPIENVRDDIRRILKERRQEQAVQEWVGKLKKQAKIEINPYFITKK